MGSFSIWHWIVVLVVVLLLFGRNKISDLMGDVAQGIKAFKKGMAEDEKPAEAKSEPIKTIEASAAAPKTESEQRAESVRS
jgi:sec-independent protein translocase protein TatA